MELRDENRHPLIQKIRNSLASKLKEELWIVAFPVLAGAEAQAKELISLGVKRVLAVGVSAGVRADEHINDHIEGIERLCLNKILEGDEMAGIRGAEALLDQLSEESLAIIDRFDPEKKARVIRVIFSTNTEFAGRAVFGSRRPEWMALEDKLIIDAFWDEIGISRSPSFNVPLSLSELVEASERLDRGDGVVVAGDNRSGFHGGATRTRWAQTAKQLNQIAKELGQECDQGRVMPFLKGIPCSIHGWVFEKGEISLRPCEMLVQQSDDTHFEYHGAAIHWLPNDRVHQQMQIAADRVAKFLKERYDYRGVFTIDGVADEERFYPTELNPRFGGAIARMATSIPDLPLLLMHYATIEGGLTDIDHEALRELILTEAAKHSSIRPMMKLKQPCAQQISKSFILQEGKWIVCDPETEHASSVKWGSATQGSMLMADIHQSTFEKGASTLSECLALLKVATLHLVPNADLNHEDARSVEIKPQDNSEEDEPSLPVDVRKPKIITFS